MTSDATTPTHAKLERAEIVTRCQVEIAKLERAKAPGRIGRADPELPALPHGRRAVEDKALAETTPEQLDQAIAALEARARTRDSGVSNAPER